MEGIKIRRDFDVRLRRFKDYFKGFENSPAVREILGDRTDELLSNLKVEFFSFKRGYMGVSDDDGHLFVSTYHLRNSDERTLYLDVVHELVHVRQFMEGKQLFDPAYDYVDRPTEREAYTHTVKEAKRLGMSDDEIFDYLKVPWVEEGGIRRLADYLGIKPSSPRGLGAQPAHSHNRGLR